MVPGARGLGFDLLLDQLRELHRSEVSALAVQVAQLQDRLRLHEGAEDPAAEPDAAAAAKAPVLATEAPCPAGAAAQVPPSVPLPQRSSAARITSGIQQRLSWVSPKSATPKRFPFEKDNYILEGQRSPLALLRRMVDSAWFELTFCALIMLNAMMLALEAQYTGVEVGIDLDFSGMGGHEGRVWPGASAAFEVFGWFFGIVFTIEILLKIVAQRCAFVVQLWNWLDLIVVLLWVTGKLAENVMPVNAQIVRLIRLARLARVLRLVRKIQEFDSLFLMTTAISGSVGVLAWSGALLFLILACFAMLLNLVLHEVFFLQDSIPIEERREVFMYFGTFTRALFSMFELTLANWPPISRVLAEYVTEWFMLISVLHKLTLGFAVVGVINGVFMQETFKVAASDDFIMLRQKQRAMKLHALKMEQLLRGADVSGDGNLDIAEFRAVFNNPTVRTWLGSMELDVRDAETLFELIDKDSNGRVGTAELTTEMAHLKGPARSIDVATLLHRHARLQAVVDWLVRREAGDAGPVGL